MAAVAGAIAAGAAATPALGADGFELGMSGPATPAVSGQPVILQVAGSNPPPSEYMYLAWLSVVLLRPSAVPSCPAGSGTANQLAAGTGGAILTIAQPEEVDSEGRFALPVGFTPLVTGPLLLCAYTYNEVGTALARASLTVDVQEPSGAGSGAPPSGQAGPPRTAAPASLAPPRLTRTGGRLLCTPGRWSNAPARYAYRWLVDGKRRTRGRTLRVTRALRGHRVQCAVTASNAGGSALAVSRRLRVR